MIGKVSQFETLSAAIEMASQSHRVTGQNLANVNTPGYKALEVDFEQLRQRLNGNTPKDGHYQVTQAVGLPARSDGNNVDMDHELAALKKNAMAYQTLTQLLGAKMGILKQAIRS
jgi:flagellar basal-body rod protein FlgB